MKKILRILMAIDGSERSFSASVYLGKMLSKQAQIVLFHVIVKTATKGGYDTIVLGRQGLTSFGEFKIGRVSRKILQFAYRSTVWIVS